MRRIFSGGFRFGWFFENPARKPDKSGPPPKRMRLSPESYRDLCAAACRKHDDFGHGASLQAIKKHVAASHGHKVPYLRISAISVG